ncbi:Similar to ankyrin repeat protein [Talaromyces stipitatus ATCC 10500]; acc. no. XP_002478261 [Pyronema omphalodes CBS 100304]|uniref:Similar to ankyrin repeat protein [Talaromyces stipitatus ATCC 10500] acc. no. XP_002478261 n=1 Tax=Pyronema omphalodes (strain CBS 100304) TaxID=1076935 RepID=U4L4H2_PYROM|nr:Similar to ankyrin repeat protein [Talaromyces stipitatus ATCC 10500]; acc. no. XP_002478261 [Pyronema omphalodes CBS 100304]
MLAFTIVTIIFLPMSFLSSFFALGVTQFPKNKVNGNISWDLVQVSRWIFGITVALCVPLLLLAFNAHRMRRMAKRTFWSSGEGKHGRTSESYLT